MKIQARSIRFKMLAPILAIILVLGISMYLLNNYTQNIVKNDIEALTMSKVQRLQTFVDGLLAEWKSEVSILASSDIVRTMDWEKINPYLSSNKDLFSEYEMFFLADRNGDSLTTLGSNANIAERDYFKRVLNGETVIADPVISKASNKPIIVVASPVRGTNGAITGVLGGTLEMTKINEMINSENSGKTSYAYMINKQGVTISHPDPKHILTSNFLDHEDEGLVEMTKKMIAGESDFHTYLFENPDTKKKVEKEAAFAPIQLTGWSIALTTETRELEQQLNTMKFTLLGILLALLIISTGVILWIISKTLKPLVQTTHMLKEISSGEGDLTKRVEVNTRDEVGELAQYFNQFVEKIQNIIRDIFQNTDVLNKSSSSLIEVASSMAANSEETSAKTGVVSSTVEEITASIDANTETLTVTSENMNMIASSVEEMSGTIRNLASASEQTSVSVGEVTELVSQISGSINSVSNSAKDVSTSVGSVATSVKEINLSLNEINKNCERSIHITKDAENKAEDTNSIIEKLNDSSKQIGKIINVINDIADQTNMLALNAAIEAAGAGEAGKGFAVVANEVKELAKQTAEATDEISHQIETMRGNMSGAIHAVKTITDVIKEITIITNTIASAVTEQSATTGDISNAVLLAAEKVNLITKEIEEVAGNSSDASRSLSEASKGVREIARSSAELSTASDEIAKNTEKASERVQDVARTSKEISEGANEISQNIQEINIAASDTASGASETSNSAQTLADVAQKLDRLVKQFKI